MRYKVRFRPPIEQVETIEADQAMPMPDWIAFARRKNLAVIEGPEAKQGLEVVAIYPRDMVLGVTEDIGGE